MQMGAYLRRDYRRVEGRKHPVKLESDVSSKVQIIVKTAKRDAEGKLTYATEETFNLLETTPKEVIALLNDAINKAVKK
jgi:hypothetical protein